MANEIPIVDDTGVEVCKVLWEGDLYQGEAKVSPIAGHERESQNVQNAILMQQDLTELHFRSEGDKARVRGWKSYEGVVGALRILLPVLGFRIGHIAGDTPALGRSRVDEIEFNLEQSGIE